MKVHELVGRACRLPLDFVLFTRDFLRATFWIATAPIYRAAGVPRSSPSFCQFIPKSAESPQGRGSCYGSWWYRNPFLFRLLCEWARPALKQGESLACECGACNSVLKISPLRWLCAAVLVCTVWGGLAAGTTALFLRWHQKSVRPPVVARSTTWRPAPARVVPAPSSNAEQRVELPAARPMNDVAAPVAPSRPAVQSSTNDWNAQVALAESRRSAGDTNGAAEAAEAAVQLVPQRFETRILAGSLQAAAGNLKAAQKHYRKALEIKPQAAEAVVGLANVSRRQGDLAAAMSGLETVLRSQPQNVEALAELVEVYVQEGDRDNAIRTCKLLVQKHPELIPVRVRLGEMQMRSGKINEGYNTLRKVLEDSPSNATAHSILADFYLQQGLSTLAVERAGNAVRLQPENAKARKLLTRALIRDGADERALRETRMLLRDTPDDVEALILAAFCYGRLGKNKEAAACCAAIEARNPESPAPHLLMAQLYMDGGAFEPAIEEYRQALKKAPDHPVALNNLAGLLLDRAGNRPGAVDEAYVCARRARGILPADTAIMETMGWAHFKRGENGEAVRLLTDAVKMHPEDPGRRYRLAAALRANGAPDEARRQLEAALSSPAGFAEADAARALLADIVRQERGGAGGK